MTVINSYLLSTFGWKSHLTYTCCVLWRKGPPLSRAMLLFMSESNFLSCAVGPADSASSVVFSPLLSLLVSSPFFT